MPVIPQPALIRVVLDDPDRRAQLCSLLVGAGFRVIQQPLPPQLLDLIDPEPCPEAADLVLLQLPSASHPMADTQALVQRWRSANTKVLLLLLAEGAGERERAALLEAGADAVLLEPMGSLELIARCKALLRRVSRLPLRPLGSGPRVLQAAWLQLFQDECRLVVDGIDVALTPREFRLLEYFMLQPGRVLSRDQLIAQVWGADYQGKAKSVDVHVWWLRHKLDRPGLPSLFVTVRGLGYRFAPPGSQ